jgi:hypothetical protein
MTWQVAANLQPAATSAQDLDGSRRERRRRHRRNSESQAPPLNGGDDSGSDLESEECDHDHLPPETVEAALSRLSKSYATAMECLAAWHHADQSSNDAVKLRFVGQSVRAAFQDALLLDPLMEPLAPRWSALVRAAATTTTSKTIRRRAPTRLTAAAHRLTVQRLTYLSLVNYADILMAGRIWNATTTGHLLDRGVVPPLQFLATSDSTCCWHENETPEMTSRLAAAALWDASTLDGSDSTMWLKLACACRRLGREVQNQQQPALLQYRRLEKHALEHGLLATPTGQPNRLIQRALQEWRQEESMLESYDAIPAPLSDPSRSSHPDTLLVSEYSWWSVGQSILAHCRLNGDLRPLIVRMSLLALPRSSLLFVCDYLDADSVQALRSTCQALSELIPNRSSEVVSTQDHVANEMPSTAEDGPALAAMTEAIDQLPAAPDPPEEPAVADESAPRRKRRLDNVAASRASKRVRSQAITSGKRVEREAKRLSLRYNFWGAVWGEVPEWDSDPAEAAPEQPQSSDDAPDQIEPASPRASAAAAHVHETDGDVSLWCFLHDYFTRPVRPQHFLCSYLARVSMEAVQDVEPRDADQLTLCWLECKSVRSSAETLYSNLTLLFALRCQAVTWFSGLTRRA